MTWQMAADPMRYAQSGWHGLLVSLTGLTALVLCTATAASPFRLLVSDNAAPAQLLYVAVYPASAQGWEAEPVLRLRHRLPETDTVDIALEVPPGDYAVRAFVDLNDNGELDLNRRGRPTEPYASSQSPDRNRRSQRFEHALITLSAEQPSVTLELTYPRETAD